MVAVEEGTIGLDDPVGQPGCTLRHLLAHAGGYPTNGGDPITKPGRRRIYSNSGIELAAAAIEQRSGMPFATYLTDAVLAPLGMTSTRAGRLAGERDARHGGGSPSRCSPSCNAPSCCPPAVLPKRSRSSSPS